MNNVTRDRAIRGLRLIFQEENHKIHNCGGCGTPTYGIGCHNKECPSFPAGNGLILTSEHPTYNPSLGYEILDIFGHKASVKFGDGWVYLEGHGYIPVGKRVRRLRPGLRTLFHEIVNAESLKKERREHAIMIAQRVAAEAKAKRDAEEKKDRECKALKKEFENMASELGVDTQMHFQVLNPQRGGYMHIRDDELTVPQARELILKMIDLGILRPYLPNKR